MKILLPLFVLIPRKTKESKKVILNLNVYRNLHHITNNQAKVIYKEIIKLSLPGNQHLLSCPPYQFTYVLYQQSKRHTDISNILSIVDKFTCDALVELGHLADDNYKFISEVVYKYGGVDKENPRAELFIQSKG